MQVPRTRYLMILLCWVAIISLAIWRLLSNSAPERSGGTVADAQKIDALNRYESQVQRAAAIAASDPAAGTARLEDAIEAAHQAGVLPLRSPWPSDGEQALLRLYADLSNPKEREFTRYLRDAYPSFNPTIATTGRADAQD